MKTRKIPDMTVVLQKPTMVDEIKTIIFGLGKASISLAITFCRELALILGVIDNLSLPVPGLLVGWTVPTKKVNIFNNNLAILWVFADFVSTTMAATARIPILKMVPIIDDTKAIAHNVFNMNDFVRVQRRRIKNFGVTIQEGPGSVDELNIRQDVVLVLYFRPINV